MQPIWRQVLRTSIGPKKKKKYIYRYIYNSLKVQKSQKIKQKLKRWKKKSGERNSADAANGRNTSTSSTHILKISDRNEIEIW